MLFLSKRWKEVKKMDEQQINKIIRNHTNFPDLVTKNNDSLDFSEVSKWGLKKMLEAAFELGKQSKID